MPLKALVNEFYQSYKPNEKVGKVRGKEIVVDAQSFHEIFKLPWKLRLMVSKI